MLMWNILSAFVYVGALGFMFEQYVGSQNKTIYEQFQKKKTKNDWVMVLIKVRNDPSSIFHQLCKFEYLEYLGSDLKF